MPSNTSTFGQLPPKPIVNEDIFAIQGEDGLNYKVTALELSLFIGGGGAGEANTISSVGGGTIPLTATIPKVGVDLQVRSISNGDGMNTSVVNDLITLAVAPTVVQTDQANTYLAGFKQTFVNSATIAGLNITPSADPTIPVNGDIWINSGSNTIKYQSAAVTRTLVDLSLSQTIINKIMSGDNNTFQNINETQLTVSAGVIGTVLTSNGVGVAPTYQALAGGGITTINGDGTAAQVIAGTAARITVGDVGATHTIDIASTYVGQTSLTTLGTITTGIWNGTAITYANLSFTNDIVDGDLATGLFPSITGLGVQTQSMDMGGTFKVTNLAEPTAPQDAATRQFVLDQVTGLTFKEACRAATTANIVLSGNQTLDGVLTVNGDRVLVKDQTSGQFNGIYIADAGAWSRSTDTDTGTELEGMAVLIQEGTTQADTGWLLSTDPPITIDVTVLVYVQFTSLGQITAGDGLTKTGNTLDVVGTANRIVANPNSIDIAATYVGQTSITTLGTIATGIWQGTLVASAFLDVDTMHLSVAQTINGIKTFLDGTLLMRNVAATFNGSFVNTNTVDRIYTLPDAAGTVVITGLASQITLGAEVTGAITDLSDVTAKTGTGTIAVFNNTPTLLTPTIASFLNATHDHSNAAGGGNLTNTALTTGVFPAITGVGVQTQIFDLGGFDVDNIRNLIHDISVSGDDIDFAEDELQTILISVNTTFTTAGRVAGKSKTLKITTDGTLRTLTFPAWDWVSAIPADQAANKNGYLTLTCYGATDALIVAAYQVGSL